MLDLLQQLARYEKLESQLHIDAAKLEALMFGPQALIHGILIYQAEQPCGMALYYYTASTFKGQRNLFIEDLFVVKSARRQGLGQALFHQLAEIATHTGCAQLEWMALKWNQPALDFYTSMGAKIDHEWQSIHLNLNAAKEVNNAR